MKNNYDKFVINVGQMTKLPYLMNWNIQNSILPMGKTESRHKWLNHDEFIIKRWSENKLSCLLNNLIRKMSILYHHWAEIELMLSKLTQ
jgi:hypothetical protein